MDEEHLDQVQMGIEDIPFSDKIYNLSIYS
jgi:hypothetical protein